MDKQLDESKMAELSADIEDLIAKGLKEYKRNGGAEALAAEIKKVSVKIAKSYGMSQPNAYKMVADFVDGELSEDMNENLNQKLFKLLWDVTPFEVARNVKTLSDRDLKVLYNYSINDPATTKTPRGIQNHFLALEMQKRGFLSEDLNEAGIMTAGKQMLVKYPAIVRALKKFDKDNDQVAFAKALDKIRAEMIDDDRDEDLLTNAILAYSFDGFGKNEGLDESLPIESQLDGLLIAWQKKTKVTPMSLKNLKSQLLKAITAGDVSIDDVKFELEYWTKWNGKYASEETVTEEFRIGQIVTALSGPHKGMKHEIIHIHEDGRMNIKPVGLKADEIHYKLGAATARADQIESLKEDTSLVGIFRNRYVSDAVDSPKELSVLDVLKAQFFGEQKEIPVYESLGDTVTDIIDTAIWSYDGGQVEYHLLKTRNLFSGTSFTTIKIKNADGSYAPAAQRGDGHKGSPEYVDFMWRKIKDKCIVEPQVKDAV